MDVHKLGLSKTETHHFKAKVEKKLVLPKADAPKQLAGYLGWSDKAKESFSTKWKTTGANAAKSIYVRDLQDGHPMKPTAQQALVAGSATVNTAFSRKLQDDMDEADMPSIDLDWGAKAKAKKAPKMALKEQS